MQREHAESQRLQQMNLIKMSHPYRVRWDIFIMTLSVFTSFTVPFDIAFRGAHGTDHSWDILNYVIDFLFLVDIVLNFFTTTIDP